MELLKDYDCTNQYHPSKANVVIDALSRNSSKSLAHINKFTFFSGWNNTDRNGWFLVLFAHFQVKHVLIDKIKATREKDDQLCKIREKSYQILKFYDSWWWCLKKWFRLCVPVVGEH